MPQATPLHPDDPQEKMGGGPRELEEHAGDSAAEVRASHVPHFVRITAIDQMLSVFGPFG